MKENTTEQVTNSEMPRSTAKSFRETKEPAKKRINLHEMREKDRTPVKGVFKYYEVPNGVLEFCFKKYDQDPVVRYELYDGVVYTLPLGVAKHIKHDMWYPIHEHRVEENGRHSQVIGKKVSRADFHHLEFVDIDDLSAAPTPQIEIVSMAKI